MGTASSSYNLDRESHRLAIEKQDNVEHDSHWGEITADGQETTNNLVEQRVNSVDVGDSSSFNDATLPVAEEKTTCVHVHVHQDLQAKRKSANLVDESHPANVDDSQPVVLVAKAGHAKIPQTDISKLSNMTEEEADAIVSECWRKIKDTFGANVIGDRQVVNTAGWRVVRLFVSSTFTDYHAERELLVKKVFPELREWCEGHHIQLIECDLRWGVPKDSTTEMTIKTCLGEIDRCKEEANNMPFFLNMLGERYGWMPSKTDIPEDIQDQYSWIFPTSITHMEILHAAHRTQNPNAVFFIRNSDFLDDIAPDLMPAFLDKSALNKSALKMLKTKLRERFPNQTLDYSCEYDGIDESTGQQKVKLKGLEEFGQMVLKQFKACIEKTFPPSQNELSSEELELVSQDNFIRSRGSLLLGRKTEVNSIIDYVNHGTLPGTLPGKTEENDDVCGDNCPLLLVQGAPGSGKSSLIAYCTLQVKKLNHMLFYHFVGSGPGSIDVLKMTNRLYKWMRSATNTETEEEDENEDISIEIMPEKMKEVFEEAAKLDKKIVIILDAVNQLSDAETSGQHLDWIPMNLPANVQFIVSAVEGSRSAKILLNEERKPRPAELLVGELNNTARREIVQHILSIYNKKLDDHQLELLVHLEGATNPLWLSLACEELRVFGVFEQVTKHIKSLPSSLQGLLQFILKRLVVEDEFNNVEKVLCLLDCMCLTETELRYLLKQEDATEPLPMMQWAVVRRTLKPFLRNTGQTGQEETLDFFHASISNVVKESLLTNAQERKKWYLSIANYFQYVCKDGRRSSEAVAVYLKKAGEKKRLLDFLRNDIRAQRQNSVWKSQFYKFIQCGQMIPQIPQFKEEVSLCQMCSMQRKGFGQLAGLNQDACVMCGQHVPQFWKQPKHVAMLCQQHKPFHAPGQKICYICNRPAFGKAMTGYTCMTCSPGFQKCVKMNV